MEAFSTGKIYNLMGKKDLLFLGLSLFSSSFNNFTFNKGIEFGIDFAGGTIVQVKYEQAALIDRIREVLNETKFKGSLLQNLEVMMK